MAGLYCPLTVQDHVDFFQGLAGLPGPIFVQVTPITTLRVTLRPSNPQNEQPPERFRACVKHNNNRSCSVTRLTVHCMQALVRGAGQVGSLTEDQVGAADQKVGEQPGDLSLSPSPSQGSLSPTDEDPQVVQGWHHGSSTTATTPQQGFQNLSHAGVGDQVLSPTEIDSYVDSDSASEPTERKGGMEELREGEKKAFKEALEEAREALFFSLFFFLSLCV